MPRLSWRDAFPVGLLMDSKSVEDLRNQLDKILYEVRPNPLSSIPGVVGKNDLYVDCNEVFPNIFLGDGYTAKMKKYLKTLGITHVLNTAMGKDKLMVDTDAKYYSSAKIKFLGFMIDDFPTADISTYFKQSSQFIEDCLSKKGKVYVHCFMGRSRSATCVIAFLIMNRGFSAEEAVRLVRSRRAIAPNGGFLRHLAVLDLNMRESKKFASDE